MLIKAITGQENFMGASAKAHLFVCTPAKDGNRYKETNILNGESAGLGVTTISKRRLLATSYGPALSLAASCNLFIVGDYDIANGTLLKLVVNRHTAAFGEMRVMANIILRVRETAAYRCVTFNLTGNKNAALQKVEVEGRFDILTLAQARKAGVAIPVHLEHYYSDNYVRRALTFKEIYPELAPVEVKETKVIEKEDGKKIEIETVRKVRKLKL